jgi:hypothetical protein
MVKAQLILTAATLAVATAFSPMQIPGNVSQKLSGTYFIGRVL